MNNKCKCGHSIDHPKVEHKSNYSKWGWFLLTVLGLSAKPKSVEFICTVCNQTITTTADSKILSKYVGR